MDVKIIDNKEKPFNGLIVWDCFKAQYTKLMYTVPHAISCSYTLDFNDSGNIEIVLHFKMFDTTGFQQSNRRVVGGLLYHKLYVAEDMEDETLIHYFDLFYDDYINSRPE